MKDYVKRMLEEEKQLRTRCEKFEKFAHNDDEFKKLSADEVKDMWQQFGFMEAYYKVLVRRIEKKNVQLLK